MIGSRIHSRTNLLSYDSPLHFISRNIFRTIRLSFIDNLMMYNIQCNFIHDS